MLARIDLSRSVDYARRMRPGFGEMTDTSPANRERYYALIAALTPLQRGEIVSRLSGGMRVMLRTELARRYPEATSRELDAKLAVRLYGREVALRHFGSLAEGPV